MSEDKVLRAANLNVFYKNRKRKLFSKNKKIQILHDVTFEMEEGEVLAIAGESGCGKSTLARTIVGINKDYTGVANPFPVDVSVQNYAVTGVAEAEGSGYTIAPITSTGNIPVNYYWWGGHEADGLPDGWYVTDDSDIIEAAIEAGTTASLLADYTFAPGEASVTFMMKTGLNLKITSPIN